MKNDNTITNVTVEVDLNTYEFDRRGSSDSPVGVAWHVEVDASECPFTGCGATPTAAAQDLVRVIEASLARARQMLVLLEAEGDFARRP